MQSHGNNNKRQGRRSSDKNKLFTDAQFGFRSLRSCALQLLDVLERPTKWIDEGNSVDIIYFDCQKAFDKVPHRRLLNKLQAYGIEGQAYNWIKSFLLHTKQRVIVNSQPSQWTEVTSGIPQGSVLGPVFFSHIYH